MLFLSSFSHKLYNPFVLQAEQLTNRLKAQSSMIAAVACATVPKITVVIGGCHRRRKLCHVRASVRAKFFVPVAKCKNWSCGHFQAVMEQ
ncbi:Carboxyl transferase domain [Pristimantis euphronides]